MVFDIKMFDVDRNIVIVESVGYESVIKHRHNFIEIVYVNSGEALHYVGEKVCEIKAGDVFIIADNSEHSINPTCKDKDFKITNIIFRHELLNQRGLPEPWEIFSFDALPNIISEIKSEYNYVDSSDYVLLLLIKNLINYCLIEKERIKRGKNTGIKSKKSADDYIDSAVRFIQNNYNKNIKISDVAAAVGLYPSYLQKIFAKYRATSVHLYLVHYRMEKACQLLSETNLPIYEISHAVGVNDIKNFYLSFKRFFSVTPKQYRESHSNMG